MLWLTSRVHWSIGFHSHHRHHRQPPPLVAADRAHVVGGGCLHRHHLLGPHRAPRRRNASSRRDAVPPEPTGRQRSGPRGRTPTPAHGPATTSASNDIESAPSHRGHSKGTARLGRPTPPHPAGRRPRHGRLRRRRRSPAAPVGVGHDPGEDDGAAPEAVGVEPPADPEGGQISSTFSALGSARSRRRVASSSSTSRAKRSSLISVSRARESIRFKGW